MCVRLGLQEFLRIEGGERETVIDVVQNFHKRSSATWLFPEALCTEGARTLAQLVALTFSFYYSQLCTLVLHTQILVNDLHFAIEPAYLAQAQRRHGPAGSRGGLVSHETPIIRAIADVISFLGQTMNLPGQCLQE